MKTKRNLINLLKSLLILSALWLVSYTPATLAQELAAPWEAAEQIRSGLFEAQKALLLNKTAEAQAQVQTVQEIFDAVLSEVLATKAPEAEAVVQGQLQAAQQVVAQDDAVGLALIRGRVRSGLLWAGSQITLQAVGWMTISPVRGLTLPYWLGLWFGLFPTWESFGFQLTAAAFVSGSYYLAEYQHKRERAQRLIKRIEATSPHIGE